MKKVIILMSLLMTSCSLTGRNIVQRNSFEISGGSYGSKSWSDELKLKRISWYQEMTMVFDALVGEITPNSSFYNWFSTAEKISLKKCDRSYLALYYSSASEVISKNNFIKQLNDQGFEKYVMSDFTSALKLHPQYVTNSFQLYDVAVLCSKLSLENNAVIEFPNFESASF